MGISEPLNCALGLRAITGRVLPWGFESPPFIFRFLIEGIDIS